MARERVASGRDQGGNGRDGPGCVRVKAPHRAERQHAQPAFRASELTDQRAQKGSGGGDEVGDGRHGPD